MNTVPLMESDELLFNNSGENQYLTFIVNNEEYGVDILRVQEIRGWEPTTPLPRAPHYVKGVINLRGTIVPVIDLRERLDMEAAEYGPMTVVIVIKAHCESQEKVIGIVVDAVSEVYNIREEEIRPTPDLNDAIDTSLMRGIATVDGKMVIMLGADHLLEG